MSRMSNNNVKKPPPQPQQKAAIPEYAGLPANRAKLQAVASLLDGVGSGFLDQLLRERPDITFDTASTAIFEENSRMKKAIAVGQQVNKLREGKGY